MMPRWFELCSVKSAEVPMKETRISVPELGLVGLTRGALGVGVGLLLANKLSEHQRRPLGIGLLAFGVLTTLPLVFELLGGGRLRRAD
jgi:hypothetical protein